MAEDIEQSAATPDNAILSIPDGKWKKIAAKADIAEVRFLSLLRYTALILAALTLILSAALLTYGAFQQIGRTNVEPRPVSLGPDDVVPTKPQQAAVESPATQTKPGVAEAVRKRTLDIYKERFKPFQRTDTKISEQEVVDFVWSEDRIAKFDELSGQKLIGKDQSVLADRNATMLDALALVDNASTTGEFKKQLTGYRDAKKVNVCNDEVRTRTSTVASWDSSATFCPSWYISPVGCASSREVSEPYVTKVCTLKYPEDLESPAQQFASAVQRYADIAEARLAGSRNDAAIMSARNQARKLEGIGHMTNSITLFGLFLGVMFLYLFIAMERHHRSLRSLIGSPEA